MHMLDHGKSLNSLGKDRSFLSPLKLWYYSDLIYGDHLHFTIKTSVSKLYEHYINFEFCILLITKLTWFCWTWCANCSTCVSMVRLSSISCWHRFSCSCCLSTWVCSLLFSLCKLSQFMVSVSSCAVKTNNGLSTLNTDLVMCLLLSCFVDQS